MQITATELKNRLGQYLDVAETDPVIVEKSGRIKSVLISTAMYEKFLAYEDAYWATKELEINKSSESRTFNCIIPLPMKTAFF